MTQNADFSAKRLMPGYAKVIMLLQSMVIFFFSFWVLQEYTYNFYFQAYVNDIVQTNGSLIAVLVFVSSLGLALGLFKVLKSTHKQIGALANQPRAPTMSPIASSPRPAIDLHPMVAALKADMAHQGTIEPIPPIEIKDTPPPPRFQAQPDPQQVKTQVGTPSTVITGTMPVLKRVNPDQAQGQNSQR
ncbi:hypothetical protein E6H28_06570 [Candidatus Bathyarchaeota archaeon]|nr:MAG: hypothetical protein E6H28_06570 [Candidatus Bathyarchaeota archaeon]